MELQCTEFLTLPGGGRRGFTEDQTLSLVRQTKAFQGQVACAKTGLRRAWRVLDAEVEEEG